MLNTLTLTHSDHPLLPFARQHTLGIEVAEGETLGELLSRAGLHPGSAPCVVTLDGMALADWQNAVARTGSIVQMRIAAHDGGGGDSDTGTLLSIALMIAAPEIGAWMASEAMAMTGSTLLGTTLTTSLMTGVVTIGGQLLIRALLPPPSAKMPTGSAAQSTASPSYSLTGGQNNARPYQPFMLVMGAHRVYPDISAKPTSLFSENENYLHQVFNYGLVPVAWLDHRIGDTPVANYSDITIVEGPNGAALTGIYQNTETVDGPGELAFNQDDWSATQTGDWTQRTTAADTVAILINVGAVCGLMLATGAGADMVQIEAEYAVAGSGVWNAIGYWQIGSDKFEMRRITVTQGVAKGQYDVRVRATAGGYDPSGHDPKSRTRRPYFFSLVCVQSEPASYAGQYRIGVKIRASGQLNGNLDRWSSLCQAQCEIWNGSAWAVQHTRNPAWWFRAVAKGATVSGRPAWGAGLADSRIDDAAIKAWGAWCDAEGLTFDAVFDGTISLSDMLSRIAFAGMASPTWATGKLGVVWQDRNDAAVAVFGMFNIKKGTFSVNYISENLADEIEATFVDRDKDYQAQTIRVLVPGTVGTPQRTVKIDLFGVTNATAAMRHARLQAAGQYYHRRRITWETDAEGLMVQRGNVVVLTHDLTQWDYSGRVVAWDAGTKTLTLERSVPLTAADTIALRWPNGCVEYLACAAGTGTSATVTLVSALPTVSSEDGTPLEAPGSSHPEHDWAWQFGPRATPGKRVRIVSITPSSDRAVKIEAVDEEAGCYDWADGTYTPPATFALPILKPYALKATETLLRLTPSGSVSRVGLSWEGPSAVTYVVRARITTTGIAGTLVGDWRDIGSATGNSFAFEANEGDYIEIEVAPFVDARQRAVYDKATATYTVLGRTVAPSNVASIAAELAAPNIVLTWPAVADIDVPTYDIRRGTVTDTWATATVLATVTGTQLQTPAVNTGTWRYFVKARDVLGLTSASAASCDITIGGPPNVGEVSSSFYDTSLTSATVTLDWPDAAPDLGLAGYQVSYGSVVKTVKASTITLPADWIGNRAFTVKTVDAKGNVSSGTVANVQKLAPTSPSGFTAQVIDNSVLLYWTLPDRTTLPVSHVRLKKGASWATAQEIGRKDGSFTTLQELESGNFTYWIAAVDTDNNESDPVSVSAEVAQAPDFVFHQQWASSLIGTLSSAILESSYVILPVDTAETWESHFSSRGWSTPQSQIDAGYSIFIEPAAASGYYEETFDYGTTLASSKITVSRSGSTVSGAPVIVTTISVSSNGTTWTDYAGFTSVYATNFRYVKVRIAVTGSGGDDLYKLTGIIVTLDAKLKNDAGTASVNAADSGGTTVSFNVPFIDITSLTVTPQGTTLLTAVVDFTDTPNPTGFKVYLFDSTGARASGTVYWSAKGY